MSNGGGLSWSAENPGMGQSPGSAPAFFPVDFERQHSATSSTGGPSSAPIYMPSDMGGSPMVAPVPVPIHQRRQPSDIDAGDPSLYRFGDPRDDLPLLDELGIFPSHIFAKSMLVLHPFREMPLDTVADSDIAGPLCCTVTLAFLLTLQGKLHFGAIYGLSVLGILTSKALLSLMADTPVPLQLVISTLGYCLLPNTILAVFGTLHAWFIGRSPGMILPLALVIIGWSAWCATSMFTRAFNLQHCRFLILYPATLFYAVFAALTIF
jgi:hypothetical protein